MRIALRSLFLITAIALLAACGGQQNSADTSTVLATVNGVPITNDMFRAYVRSLAGGQEPQLDAQRRQLVLNRLVDMEVLGQAAQKSGLENQATVAADLKIQRTGLLAQQLVQQYLSQHPVTEDQIKAEYAAKTKAMPGTEYRARHILVASEQQARDIISQLNRGANFATLAKKYSSDASKSQGGELGWFSPDQMVPAFSAAVAQLKKGEYTKSPVHTQFGWHVIQLEDTRSMPPPSLNSVRDQLTNSLEGQEVEAYVNQLRQGAKVVISTPAAGTAAKPPAVMSAPAATPAPKGGTKP
ncbi:MAG: peptidylprolyl isomerase [Gammaproteobacteria bacterium]|nr:peptidylprolyl isomerase [Gammaproteobacteria bacterium]MBU6508663.1 peptidylprolyl isomerase [Gammaproteobacteria bacterium]MDE1982982.1 peptidylprolyl isomerase [Gammaproteobacteria bacterium]MDE2107731.1 peptidylprolyl isomerase [Gammaproteobacteria bacterium]MDE2459716.1 peptidylprolyl isomerase [Gammaproteobacteria bacterium]